MNKEWKLVRLGDYISIKSGLAYQGSKIGMGDSYLLGMGCVSFKDKFVDSGARLYDGSNVDNSYYVSPGDIVLATRQQSDNLPILAMPAIIPDTFANKKVIYGTNLYKVDNNSCISNGFLFWLLKHQHYVNYIAGVKSGTAVQMVTKKNVENYKFFCPPQESREKIADILWSYDELIENNNKRIAILEQMAENLYKEWFVRFRFPGHETAEFENGIPKDWEYVKLGDVLSFERGISYSSEEIDCDEGLNLINLKNIEAFGGFRRDGIKKYNGKYKDTQVVKTGDLILGVTDMTQDRRTVGAVALIPTLYGTSVISADLVKVISDIPNYYLYCLCRYGFYSKYFSQFANGANVLHLKPNTLLNKKLLLPKRELVDSFTEKVTDIISLIDKLNLNNDNLTKQRDLLLPRLMSGKLEV